MSYPKSYLLRISGAELVAYEVVAKQLVSRPFPDRFGDWLRERLNSFRISTISNGASLVLGITLCVALVACRPYTIVTVAEATRIAAGEAFDAVSFVEAKWADITSTILEQGVDLATILAAIETDSTSLVTKENLQSNAWTS